MAHVPQNFLGLPDRLCDYATARYAVLPIPYDATTSYRTGTRNGPAAIIAASQQVEWYDPELGREFVKPGIATLEPIEPEAAGPHVMHETVFKAARKVVRDGKVLIGLGGEHSVTSGLLRAVMTKHKQVSVLQIDAHADLRDEYHGTGYSHACVMHRALDLGAGVVGVGIRSMSAPEAKLVGSGCVTHVTADDCFATNDWLDRAIAALGQNVYVTIDIDGFDPAYAPGTGTPVPGGLTWGHVTALLKRVAKQRTVVAADCVEVAPLPEQNVTEFLAASLICKLIAYLA